MCTEQISTVTPAGAAEFEAAKVPAAGSSWELQTEKRHRERRVAGTPSLRKLAPEHTPNAGELRKQGRRMLQGDR